MPKYFEDKIFNHYLYFTTHCIVEAMHVHAGNEEMSEDCAAKFFVRADGSSVMKRRGDLTKKEQVGIQRYIKKHYIAMYAKTKSSTTSAPSTPASRFPRVRSSAITSTMAMARAISSSPAARSTTTTEPPAKSARATPLGPPTEPVTESTTPPAPSRSCLWRSL